MAKYRTWVLTVGIILLSAVRGPAPDVYALDIVPTYSGSVPAGIQTAFNYAAGKWNSWVHNSQVGNAETEISVGYQSLGAGVLGSAGPTWLYGVGDTAYLPTQAAQFFGKDPSGIDGTINFGNAFTWYTGTDGNTPAGEYDLVSVALHEIGHQMGFLDTYHEDHKNWGYIPNYGSTEPAITLWDKLLKDEHGHVPKPYDVESPTSVDVTGSIYFTGPEARAANGGLDVPIYAPDSYQAGSSLSHLDEQLPYSNFLMSYSIGAGQSVHKLSGVETGMLQDLGWNLTAIPEPGTFFLFGLGGFFLFGLSVLARLRRRKT
jgi:hypothetical protein